MNEHSSLRTHLQDARRSTASAGPDTLAGTGYDVNPSSDTETSIAVQYVPTFDEHQKMETRAYWEIVRVLSSDTAKLPQPFLKGSEQQIKNQVATMLMTPPAQPDRNDPDAHKLFATGGTAHVHKHGETYLYKFMRLNAQELAAGRISCISGLQFALEGKTLPPNELQKARSPFVVDVLDAHVVKASDLHQYVNTPEDADKILTERLNGSSNLPADAVLVIKMPRVPGTDVFTGMCTTRVPVPIPPEEQQREHVKYCLKFGGLHVADGPKTCSFILGLLLGVQHIQRRRMMHADIKPENVISYEDPNSGLIITVITDCEGAVPVGEDGRPLRLSAMTPLYMLGYWFGCPESVLTDLWGCGCIILQKLIGPHAFRRLESVEAGRATPFKPINALLVYIAKTDYWSAMKLLTPSPHEDGSDMPLLEYQQLWAARAAPIANAEAGNADSSTAVPLGTDLNPTPFATFVEFLYSLKGQTIAQSLLVLAAQCMHSGESIHAITKWWQPYLTATMHRMYLPEQFRFQTTLCLPVDGALPVPVENGTAAMTVEPTAELVTTGSQVHTDEIANAHQDVNHDGGGIVGGAADAANNTEQLSVPLPVSSAASSLTNVGRSTCVSQILPRLGGDIHVTVDPSASFLPRASRAGMADTFANFSAAFNPSVCASSHASKDGVAGSPSTVVHDGLPQASFSDHSTGSVTTGLRQTSSGGCSSAEHRDSISDCLTHPDKAISVVERTDVPSPLATSTDLAAPHPTASQARADETLAASLTTTGSQLDANLNEDVPWPVDATNPSSMGSVRANVMKATCNQKTADVYDDMPHRTNSLISAVHDDDSWPQIAQLSTFKLPNVLSRTSPGYDADNELSHIITRCSSFPMADMQQSRGQAPMETSTAVTDFLRTRTGADSMTAMCSHTGADLYEEAAVPANGKPMSLLFDKVKSLLKKTSKSEEAAPKAPTTTNSNKPNKVIKAKKRVMKALQKLAGCFGSSIKCDEIAAV